MSILITGGTGFVLGNLVKHLLQARPDTRVVVLDISVDADLARSNFGGADGQLRLVEGDVCDQALLGSLSRDERVTHVVHGATVTHDGETERGDPTRYIRVNLDGTLAILEWLRTLPDLERYIHVSTGGVYGDPSALSPRDMQPETGPFDPPELYAVSKYAAELVVRRYGTLFGLPVCRIRLSDVFGPMERPTGARAKSSMSLPYRMMRATIERRPLRVSEATLRAGGDFLSAEDIAAAVEKLLFCQALPYDVFNIAAGQRYPVPELFEIFGAIAPEFRYQVVSPDLAEIHFDPNDRLARFNAYAISRISELDWRPRPLEVQFRSYREWVARDPETRCPSLD
jgi:nucleoside-diphosphate-sugar epimerase